MSNLQQATKEFEPDGIPNALNPPLTLPHRNIWYHLGLAYYLKVTKVGLLSDTQPPNGFCSGVW